MVKASSVAILICAVAAIRLQIKLFSNINLYVCQVLPHACILKANNFLTF